MKKKQGCPFCEIDESDSHVGHDLFLAFYRSSSYGIVIMIDNRFHSANPALLRMLGYTEKEFMLLDRRSLTHPDDFKGSENILEDLKKRGYARIERETRYLKKDGSYLHGRVDGFIYPVKGHSLGVVLIQDISIEKENLKELNDLKERYRLTIDSMTDMIHVIDKDYRITLVNQGFKDWAKEFGLPADVIGKEINSIFRFLPEIVMDEYRLVFSTGQSLNTIEKTVLKGREIHTDTRKKPIFVEGKVRYILTVVRDVTYQRKAEEALKASEAKYTSITENATDAIFTKDNRRRYTYVNPAAERLMGLSRNDIIGRVPEDVFGREAVKDINELDDLCYKGKIANSVKELTFSGKKYVLHTIQVPIKDSNGKVIGISGIVRDMTAYHSMEKELLQSKEKFEDYINIAGVMLLALDKDGRVTFINRRGCEIIGYDEEDILGKDWFENYISEQKRPEVRKVFDSLMQGKLKISSHNENRILTRNGKRLISWENTILHDADGKIIGTLSSGEDITEKSKALEDLQKSKELLEGVVNSASDIIFSTDKKGIITTWNPTAEFITKYRAEEVMDTSIFDSPVFNDIEKLQEFLTDELIDRKFRLSVTSKRGRIKDLELTVSALEGVKGTIGFVFIGREIRKQSKNIEKGEGYLVQDSNLGSIIEILPEYKEIIFISRNISDMQSLRKYSIRSIELNQGLFAKGLGSLPALLKKEKKRDSMIYLDRIDYMISLFGFDAFMHFLYGLVDMVRHDGDVLMVNADKRLLSEREFNLLQSELRYFEDSVPHELDYEYLEIMKFIAEKQMRKINVTIKEVRLNLKISSVTARKRIAELVERGLLNISKKGRSKVITLTKTGKSTVRLHYNITI